MLTGGLTTMLAGLAAASPVITTAIRAIANGWLPLADQGTIATRAYEVFGAHTPLVGQYSFASRAAGQLTYDPGPMLYWLLALPARFGGPPALTAVIAALNTGAIVGSVVLARRRGGLRLMFASAAALALMSRSFSSEALHGIWNPSAALFALTLLCFVCWAVACGEHRLLALAVALASFVVQCHLAYVAPAFALLLVALVGLAAALRRTARQGRDAWRGARYSLRLSLLATVVVAAVCWSAPLVDQVAHSGNLGRLATAATRSHRDEGANVGWRALTSAIGIPPRFLRAARREASGPHGRAVGPLSGGDYGDTRLGDILSGPSVLAAVSCVLALAGLLGAVAVGLRARRGDVVAGATIGLLLAAAFAWMASATPLQDLDTLGYTLWWGSLVGMWVWLILGWSIATLARDPVTALVRRSREGRAAPARRARRETAAGPRPWPRAVGLAIVIACAAPIAASEPPDTHEPEFHPTRELGQVLAAALPRGRTVVVAQRGLAVLPLGPALIYELRRRGFDVVAQAASLGRERGFVGRPQQLLVTVSEDAPPVPHAIVLARATLAPAPWLPGAEGARSVTVALVPGSLRTGPPRERS